MGRYSEYGLHDNKKSQEDGKAGVAYCLWCEKHVNLGYSLCFVNWVICLPCTIEGLRLFDKPKKSERIIEDACFKQKQWGKPNEVITPCFMSKSLSIGLSVEELRTGFQYLSRNMKIDKNGQLGINF